MKTLHLLSTGLLMIAASLTACNKAQYNVSPDKSAQAVISDEGATNKLTNTVAEDAANTSRLVISNGYVNTSYLSVWGNERTEFESKEIRKIDLFQPLRQAGVDIGIPAHYDNMTVTMTTTASNGNAGMYFKGLVRIGDNLFVPVELMLSSPMQLVATSRLQSVQESTTLINLLNIMPERIGMGITSKMWEAARKPGSSSITVSSEENADIYRIMVSNLSSMARVSFNGVNTADLGSSGM